MEVYRVFISCSHNDMAEVKKIVDVLTKNGLKPMWDENFAFGFGFHEQIQTFITHAHVFMPYITKDSSSRGWVHQEIGYAMALNIPVLPVTRNMVPGEMLQRLHAVCFGEELNDLENRLSWQMFDNLINDFQKTELALYKCAEHADDRTMMMVNYANNILKLKEYGYVRQKGGLSSFNIPDKVVGNPVWRERYYPETRSDFHCRNQLEERIALQKHVEAKGCRLIINPIIQSDQRSARAQIVRLRTLLDFLQSMPDDKMQIVFNYEMPIQESLTIVGDWFAAESVSGSVNQGFKQTIFTCHAPSMRSRIELFDWEFDELLQRAGWTKDTCQSAAIEKIQQIITSLQNNL